MFAMWCDDHFIFKATKIRFKKFDYLFDSLDSFNAREIPRAFFFSFLFFSRIFFLQFLICWKLRKSKSKQIRPTKQNKTIVSETKHWRKPIHLYHWIQQFLPPSSPFPSLVVDVSTQLTDSTRFLSLFCK